MILRTLVAERVYFKRIEIISRRFVKGAELNELCVLVILRRWGMMWAVGVGGLAVHACVHICLCFARARVSVLAITYASVL